MTHVSRKKLDEQTEGLLDDSLGNILSNLSSKEVHQILPSLLSKTEVSMLKKRLLAYILLREDVTQDQVSENLKITRQTVARFKYQMMDISPKSKKALFKKAKKWTLQNKFRSFMKKLTKKDIERVGFRKI